MWVIYFVGLQICGILCAFVAYILHIIIIIVIQHQNTSILDAFHRNEFILKNSGKDNKNKSPGACISPSLRPRKSIPVNCEYSFDKCIFVYRMLLAWMDMVREYWNNILECLWPLFIVFLPLHFCSWWDVPGHCLGRCNEWLDGLRFLKWWQGAVWSVREPARRIKNSMERHCLDEEEMGPGNQLTGHVIREISSQGLSVLCL